MPLAMVRVDYALRYEKCSKIKVLIYWLSQIIFQLVVRLYHQSFKDKLIYLLPYCSSELPVKSLKYMKSTF